MMACMMQETVYGAIIEIKGGLNVLLADLVRDSPEMKSLLTQNYESMMLRWTGKESASPLDIQHFHRGLNMVIQVQLSLSEESCQRVGAYLLAYLQLQYQSIVSQKCYNQHLVDLLVDVCRTLYYLFQKMTTLAESPLLAAITTVQNYYGIC